MSNIKKNPFMPSVCHMYRMWHVWQCNFEWSQTATSAKARVAVWLHEKLRCHECHILTNGTRPPMLNEDPANNFLNLLCFELSGLFGMISEMSVICSQCDMSSCHTVNTVSTVSISQTEFWSNFPCYFYRKTWIFTFSSYSVTSLMSHCEHF